MIKVERMDNIQKEGRDISTEVAMIFVDSYYNDLTFLSRNKEKLVLIFKEAFIPQTFYIALMDDQVAGILACANNKTRALKIPKEQIIKNIGFVRGSLMYMFLQREFHTPLAYDDYTAYIESVATHPRARGKGVATKLLEYIIKNLSYQEFRLTVKDTNKSALTIYNRLGFKEFDNLKAGFFEKKWYNYKLYMRLKREEERANQPIEQRMDYKIDIGDFAATAERLDR